MQTVTVADMMMAREARAMMQMQLLREYPGAALVCLTMNAAGPVKTTPNIERAFAWGLARVRAVLAPYKRPFNRDVHAATGPEAIIAVHGDAMQIKRRLCALEDGCAMGRLLDIDVIRPDAGKVSRTELGLPPRRCLLCENAAPVCARSRAHSVEQLVARTNAIIDAHFEDEFAKRTAMLAERALLCEVAVTPKPGLVDRANNGAHRDMDMFTFMHSAAALRGYFDTCARTGLAHRGGEAAACFDALRVPGLMAEADMLAATGGVNTHKGAIFCMGIACASLGMGYGSGESAEQTLLRCGEMTRARMASELERAASGEAATFGERLYKQTGVGGARAEAAAGFPSVREAGLPVLRRAMAAGLSLNDAGLCALVALMARMQDTNAVRRGGADGARRLREDAADMLAWIEAELSAIEAGGDAGAFGDALRDRMAGWDARLTRENVSPGGCADMLAMAMMMKFAEGEGAAAQSE